MLRLLACQLALHWRPLRRCRLALAAALAGLLPLALLPLLPWPAPTVPITLLPGTPVGVAVDAATHRVLLSTVEPDALLALDGSGAPMLGLDMAAGDGHPTTLAVDPGSGYVYVATTLPRLLALAGPGAAPRLLALAGPGAAPLVTIRLDQQPVAIAVNPGTSRVYVATRAVSRTPAPDALVVLDGADLAILTERPIGPGPLRLAVDSTANHVYVADDGSDTLTVLDGTSNALLATLPLGSGPHELAVNGRTGRVYVSNAGDHSLAVLDGPHLRLLATVRLAGLPGAVAVNERTDRVYVADDSGAIVVLDGATNHLLGSVPVGQHPARLALDAARNRLYVADPLDGTLWLLQDGRFGRPTAHVMARADQTAILLPQEGSGCGC